MNRPTSSLKFSTTHSSIFFISQSESTGVYEFQETLESFSISFWSSDLSPY